MEHGHQVIIWALTFDLVYYGNEQDVAALGAQVAIAGAPDALIDALVRPLIDLVAAGRQHTLAEVTKLMVDRYGWLFIGQLAHAWSTHTRHTDMHSLDVETYVHM